MRKQLLFIAFILPMFVACGSGEGDVLASWKGPDMKSRREVTRGEFYKAMGSRKKYILRRKAPQINMLRNTVFNKLLAQQARAENWHKTDSFKKKLSKQVEKKLLLRFFLQNAFPRKGLEFSIPAHKIRHIVVRVPGKKKITELDPKRFDLMKSARKQIKDKKKLEARLKALKNKKRVRYVAWTDAELAKLKAEKMKKIKQAQSELKAKKGKNFAEVAKKYGEDGTKNRGGDLGYLVKHQQRMDKKFLEEALKIKPGQVSGIVETPFGYHLIKCDKIVKMTDSNLGDYYKDKRKRKMAERKFWYAAVWQFLDDALQNDKNVKQYPDRLKSNDPKAVIFEIKSPKYSFQMTLGELEKKLKSMNPYVLRRFGINRDKDSKKPFTYDDKKKFFDWEVTMPILRYGAYKKGYTESDEFKQAVKDMADSVLVNMKKKVMFDRVKVTEKMKRDYYEKNKKRFVRRIPVKNAPGKKRQFKTEQQSYKQVAKRIEMMLTRQKQREVLKQKESKLFRKYDVKLFTDKLEVVKPKARKPRRKPVRKAPVKKTQKK